MTPNLYQLEIHVTYRCNLHCAHCSNLVSQAPSKEDMPIDKIIWLLRESKRVGHKWKWLVMHGGEPTLHPDFEMICMELTRYKKESNNEVIIFLCTNGYGDFVSSKIRMAESFGIVVHSSNKTGETLWPHHYPIGISPLDIGEDYNIGCYQTERCGIAFNNIGFFECSPAASMARLFGYDAPVKSIDDLTVENLSKGFTIHCGHCGLSRKNLECDPSAPLSKTWKDAIDKYKITQICN